MKEILDNYLENIQIMLDSMKNDSTVPLKKLKELNPSKDYGLGEQINEINTYLKISKSLHHNQSMSPKKAQVTKTDNGIFEFSIVLDNVKSKTQLPSLSNAVQEFKDMDKNLEGFLTKMSFENKEPCLELSKWAISEGEKNVRRSLEQLLVGRVANLNTKIAKISEFDPSVVNSYNLLKNSLFSTYTLHAEIITKLDFSLVNSQKQNESLKDTLEDFMNQIRQFKLACNLSETRYSYLQRDMEYQKECYDTEIDQLRAALAKKDANIYKLNSELDRKVANIDNLTNAVKKTEGNFYNLKNKMQELESTQGQTQAFDPNRTPGSNSEYQYGNDNFSSDFNSTLEFDTKQHISKNIPKFNNNIEVSDDSWDGYNNHHSTPSNVQQDGNTHKGYFEGVEGQQDREFSNTKIQNQNGTEGAKEYNQDIDGYQYYSNNEQKDPNVQPQGPQGQFTKKNHFSVIQQDFFYFIKIGLIFCVGLMKILRRMRIYRNSNR